MWTETRSDTLSIGDEVRVQPEPSREDAYRSPYPLPKVGVVSQITDGVVYLVDADGRLVISFRASMYPTVKVRVRECERCDAPATDLLLGIPPEPNVDVCRECWGAVIEDV